MPQPQSQTTITTPDKHPTVYGFSSGLLFFTSTVPPLQTFTYSAKGNLRTKGSSATLTYASATRIHAVTSATVKGSARSYSYDEAGYVVSDSKRTYQWTSFGQLRQLDYLAAPDLRDFSGNLVHAASRVTSTFDFDSGGNRARQTKERIAANDSRKIEFTLYLGSYEREVHQTKTNGTAPAVLAKTVHRHSLGGGVIYTRTSGGSDPGVKLMAVLADHLGSTDVIVTGKWNTSTAAFANITTERQSFDAWGERRAADTQVNFRVTDGDAFRTSAQEHHRGYTGHEQLDDSGLIHMNGRIYDPELGRFLSPDPYVQIPEYSQNFNRYSYVLNNPLNATDPSGFSFLSKFFSKVGSWIKENWRTVVVIVVAAVLTFTPGGQAFIGGLTSALAPGLTAASWTVGAVSISGAQVAAGAAIGAITGGLNAGLAGGDLGDILRGAVVGGIQGAIASGPLHGMEAVKGLEVAHMVGHGILGGATNAAMGGKFQDGFLSAAASAAASRLPYADGSTLSRTVKAGVIGGTASVLGGGKFSNGAYTAAFQHMLNAEIKKLSEEQLTILRDTLRLRIDRGIGIKNEPIKISDQELEIAMAADVSDAKTMGYEEMNSFDFNIAMIGADGFFFFWATRGNPYFEVRIPGTEVTGLFRATDLNYVMQGISGAIANSPLPNILSRIELHNWNQYRQSGDMQQIRQIHSGKLWARVGYKFYNENYK